jgi:DNA-binding NarL/FixJ family response regulator
MSKSVLIVEDDTATASSFAYSVSGVSSLSLVAVVRTVADAKRFLAAKHVDVCLVDLGLPDGSGLEVIRYATAMSEPVHVLVCSMFGDEKNVIDSIEAGAAGYILKDALTTNVAHEIETLLLGGSALSPIIAKMLLKRFRSNLSPAVVNETLPDLERVNLSPRESEVLNLIARGYSYAEVADTLKITSETVNVHLRNTYKKLAVHSKSEAVYEASRLGLLKMGE